MQALPDIFSTWSVNYIAPGLMDVFFGVNTISGIYGTAYTDAMRDNPDGQGSILSTGCGDGHEEIALAKYLLGKKFEEFSDRWG